MAKGPKYVVKFRRERERKTDYKKRLALLKSGVPRLVVRISNKNILVQLISYIPSGDKVLSTATSKELSKFSWTGAGSNMPAAYLVAYLCVKKAIKSQKDLKKAILDIGFVDIVAGSKSFAALKGALDAGLEIPHSESVLPGQDRIEGKHINDKIKSQFEASKKAIDSKF